MLSPSEVAYVRSLQNTDLIKEFLDLLPEENRQAAIEQVVDDPWEVEAEEQSYTDRRNAKRSAEINLKIATAQEIGPLPPIMDPQRRADCSVDILKCCREYFAPTFYLPLAPYQVSMLKAFQDALLNGGRECKAVRRGGLKSTCARVAALWATINGHRKFTVLVGATDPKANEHRKNLFKMLMSSPTLLEDFPELIPLMGAWKQPKKKQRLDGRLLTVAAKDEDGRIMFPDIDGTTSCESIVVPYSIRSTDVSGLSFVNRDGVVIRPDAIIYDDVQTPQSARSPSQTDDREETISKVFGGLKGMGDLAEVMVCTVREHDCLSMRYLSRERHPDWNGHRYPSIIKMPSEAKPWERYAEMLHEGHTAEEGKRIAQQFYVDNREAMDKGAVIAWEYDKLPDEVSALQSLMTIRFLKPAFFRTDIQQVGAVPVDTSGLLLSSAALISRLSHVPRGYVPPQATFLTAFIDSSDEVLWWMVCAWAPDFSGWVVDYGTWPDQKRAVFQKNDLLHKISDGLPGASWEEAFTLAHNELEDYLVRDWPVFGGGTRQLDVLLKDWSDGGQMPRVKSQVLASPNQSILRCTKGFAPKPGKKPVHLYGDKTLDRHNHSYWVERRDGAPMHVQYDTNVWKSNAARRLLTVVGAPSAVTLPGDDEIEHRLLSEHFTAEAPKQITYDGATGTMYELLPARDNDWWDCFVGCNVGASMQGCAITGEKSDDNTQRRTFQLPQGARR